MRNLLAIFSFGVLVGCSSMPPEMELDSKVYSGQNAGIVVGALIEGGPYGTWLEFRQTETGQSFGWGAKDYFSAWLPAGDYEVHTLGSRRGVMAAYSKPLRFTVRKGHINYLGEMVYDCQMASRLSALYGVKSCGALALGECSVPVPTMKICVVDRKEQAVLNFRKRYPDYSSLPIASSVMANF